jgi:hypothetical protein
MRQIARKGAFLAALALLSLGAFNAYAMQADHDMICECHQWSDGTWSCHCYQR